MILENIHEKKHIVEIEPLIYNRFLVHHIDVFHCEVPKNVDLFLYKGHSFSKPQAMDVCARMIASWVKYNFHLTQDLIF